MPKSEAKGVRILDPLTDEQRALVFRWLASIKDERTRLALYYANANDEHSLPGAADAAMHHRVAVSVLCDIMARIDPKVHARRAMGKAAASGRKRPTAVGQ